MKRVLLSLALAGVLLASGLRASEAHVSFRRVWVRDEWGRKVLVCERYERVYYLGAGKHEAWVPVPCKRG